MTKYADIITRRGYLEQFPYCELSHYLAGAEWDKLKAAYNQYLGGEQVHHIARRKGKLFDTRPNFLTVGIAAHAFVHKYEDLGMLACLYVKVRKDEFDVRTINECLGMPRPDADPLGGWLASKQLTRQITCNPWVTMMVEVERAHTRQRAAMVKEMARYS